MELTNDSLLLGQMLDSLRFSDSAHFLMEEL